MVWLHQIAPGRFEETTLTAELPSPVHVEAVDIDGDLDLLAASMGQVFPNNELRSAPSSFSKTTGIDISLSTW